MTPQDKPAILIADDSRVVRVSLKNILKHDCHLVEAEDGQQAWELLLEYPDIGLIFSDLGMPKLDGRGLLQKIRNCEIARIRSIPFIVVTGNEVENGTRDALQDMGATEVISKPFNPAQIVSFVSTLMSPRESESYMLLPETELQTQFLPDVLAQSDFTQNASKELSFAIRNKNELAIGLLRVDQFDQLSAHYSDTAIEHILLTTAEIIRQHIHPDDTMAYFGDGLFAMLRPASNAIGTRYIGRRIVEDMAAKQFYLGESNDLVSVSVGISAPQIKPGIRLRELLLLAEGRLKAAMDLGGGRVVDRGSDTLTPVGLVTDTLPSQPEETTASSLLQSDSIRASHLRVDATSNKADSPAGASTLELENRIERLQAQLKRQSEENRELQEQIERWRKQSGETEQLRRRIFELESEHQQMQLKLNELANNNHNLQIRANEAEEERQVLLDSEAERNSTLKQANQFYEQENLRLEGQLEAVNNRAQKAELAYRKSEQLVLSLKDNIKLLRSQMEHLQHQLVEAQAQVEVHSEPQQAVVNPTVDENSHPALDEETYIETRSDSELLIDGFPSSKPLPREERIESASVVQLFSEPSPNEIKQTAVNEPAIPKQPATPRTPAVTDEPELSIPVYRVPERELGIKPRRPLSSFTIASLIMVLLLCAGGGYFYFYWQNGIDPVAETATPQQASGLEMSAKPDPVHNNGRSLSTQTESAQKAGKTTTLETASTATTQPAVSRRPAPLSTADGEAVLQAELTLRQIAEEEFKQRLQQVDVTASSPSAPIANNRGKSEGIEASTDPGTYSDQAEDRASATPSEPALLQAPTQGGE
jgi:diguanylate cyclase (GGDEF)-like protein